MSAVTSNSSELEALRRAQRAHEPSMEEILASIRNIITDDRDPAKFAASRSVPARPAPPSPGPQIVYSQDAPMQTEPGPPQDPESAQTFAASPSKIVPWRQPDPSDSKPAEAPGAAQDEPLMSPEASSAVASAFETLSAALAARTAEIDGMVREMLRPMLKTWLDENLPEIVDRLVRLEIERLSRGTRSLGGT